MVIKEISPIDRFEIKGRGTVFVGKFSDYDWASCEVLEEMRNNKEPIRILGKVYRIIGIEQPCEKFSNFGILVKGAGYEKDTPIK